MCGKVYFVLKSVVLHFICIYLTVEYIILTKGIKSHINQIGWAFLTGLKKTSLIKIESSTNKCDVFLPSNTCISLHTDCFFSYYLINYCRCKLSFSFILNAITAHVLSYPEVIVRFPILVNQGHCLPLSITELSRFTLKQHRR